MSKISVTWVGLLSASGVLICAATLAGFLGRFWWGFELATHFRVQYAVMLAVTSALLCRQQHLAGLFALFALVNGLILAPRFLPLPIEDGQSSQARPALRVLLANVNSANRDARRIRETVLASQADFVALLEATPWLLEQLSDLADRYPHRVAAPREDNFGIALLSRQPFLRAEVVQFSTAGLPSIIAELADGPRHFTLVATHPLPPVSADLARDRNEQLATLAEFARQSTHPLLLVGDLNISPWSPHFARLLADSGLRDSGYGISPSWPVGWLPLQIPIDHALFSAGIHIKYRKTGTDLGSDHYPIIVDFQIVAP